MEIVAPAPQDFGTAETQGKSGSLGIALARLEDLVNWGRTGSVWPLTFGLACCAIEQISAGMARFDIARFGAEVFRASPQNLLLVSLHPKRICHISWQASYYVCRKAQLN